MMDDCDTIFFVDFDGTVTTEETMVGAVRRIAPPALVEAYSNRMMSGELTLSAGLKEAFGQVPSNQLPRILEYIETVPVRPGFEAFLEAAEAAGFPVVILSGGLRPSVEAKLAPWRGRLLDIHAVELDTSGPNMRLVSPYDDGVELMAKRQVMAKYRYRRAACIGDSYTDIRMAEQANVVFARDQLAKILTQQGRPFLPWVDFHDIAAWIRGE